VARREMTMERFREIKYLIDQGQSDRQISRALKCRRMRVAEIRRGEGGSPEVPKLFKGPVWVNTIDWKGVKEDLGYKHPLKFIWEEKAQSITTYSNFWKVFYRKFPYLKKGLSVPRDFEAGERVEVDWAGGKVEWIDRRTGEIHEAVVFIGCLGYSQLIFAYASENMKSRAFLEAHRRMFEFYGGVPKVTVPDCTKTAVLKCHLYDPDLNPAYSEMGRFYKTAIVPARPYRPKDKALAEGAVKLVMRYFRYLYRRHTFLSIFEINEAFTQTTDRINKKAHTRFKVSRLNRFEKFEKAALKPLPSIPFESIEWKEAILHPDCTVFAENNFYSAPHIHRGKTLRLRLSETTIEIFLETERLATHVRYRGNNGKKILNPDHFPENAKAYFEATPKNLLSQARFLSQELYELIDELFKKDTCGHIRIVQGFIRNAAKHINETNNEEAKEHFKKAIDTMRSYNRFRVGYFRELLKAYQIEIIEKEDREITRKPGNEMLRHTSPEKTDSLKCPKTNDSEISRGKGTPENNQLLLPISEVSTKE
jgi:hypothetical protein